MLYDRYCTEERIAIRYAVLYGSPKWFVERMKQVHRELCEQAGVQVPEPDEEYIYLEPRVVPTSGDL